MAKTLNFSKNHNNQLNNSIFVIIRPANYGLNPLDKIVLSIDYKFLGYAMVRSVKTTQIKNIDELIFCQSLGVEIGSCGEILKGYNVDISNKENFVDIIMIKRMPS